MKILNGIPPLTEPQRAAKQLGIPVKAFDRLVQGGGVPVVLAGQVVGAVAVSGLHEQEDMRLAALGVAAICDALSGDTKAAAE